MKLPRISFALCLAIAAFGAAWAQESGEEAAAQSVSINPLSELRLESLEATRQLPLFTPSRSPPVVEKPKPVVKKASPPPPPPPSPPPLELVGIIATESTEVALLRDPSTSEVHRLSANDDYNGWSMTIVDVRTVEFRNGDQTKTLRMFDEFDTGGGMAAFGFQAGGEGQGQGPGGRGQGPGGPDGPGGPPQFTGTVDGPGGSFMQPPGNVPPGGPIRQGGPSP